MLVEDGAVAVQGAVDGEPRRRALAHVPVAGERDVDHPVDREEHHAGQGEPDEGLPPAARGAHARVLPALEADVEQSEGQGDGDEDVADGGAGAEGGHQVAESEPVGPGGQGGGGAAGPALGHDPDDVEDLERVDEPEQQGDGRDRSQQGKVTCRKRCQPVAPSRAAASYTGGADRLEAGVEDDEVERDADPDVGGDHRPQRPVGRGQPVDRARCRTSAEDGVDHAGVAVEHPGPGGGGHDQRQQPRHQEQGAQRRRQREVPDEEQGEGEPEGELEGQRHDGEHDGVPQRGPEGGVGEDLEVVGEPGEGRVALDEGAHRVVAQAQLDVAEHAGRRRTASR